MSIDEHWILADENADAMEARFFKRGEKYPATELFFKDEYKSPALLKHDFARVVRLYNQRGYSAYFPFNAIRPDFERGSVKDAVMGSLAFCSEFKYGIKKSNSFCNDPLSYVVKTDLNALYDFENIFIETARAVLSDSSVSYKSQGHLTNGVQTAGNIFVQGKVLKTEIENIIHTEIKKYQIQFKDSEEGFIKNWPTSYEIKGWLVCMQSGGKLAPHMHDNGWITGSIYINVPPKSKTDCGNLVLCLSDQEHVLAVEKNQQSTIDVVTGSLCLFPSSLHHYTIPFEEKEDRIVLAFDVIPK